LVDGCEASDHAKHRARVFLETLTGLKTVPEACAELGLGEAAFHEARRKMLQAAVVSAEPAPPGRPAAITTIDPVVAQVRIAELEVERNRLRVELEAARIREEIALVMPHLRVSGKKNSKR
jgi:hypothetical protein